VTDIVDDFLAHYGVKGMKWGVRREPPEVVLKKTLKGGGEVLVTKDKPAGLAKIFPKMMEDAANFTIRDGSGKKVGEASFLHAKGSEDMYLEWLGVRKSARGQGYATAAFEGAVNYAKANGVKKLSLDVPSTSKDAQHIYTSFGFKPTERNDDRTLLFGYSMELELAHATPMTLIDYVIAALNRVED
jgi:ribosomal protein S18 acetylase RimI-like enzyme